jgi:acetylornithine deacetylase/succinyl-diaminopimelate desuccinylase-like protein
MRSLSISLSWFAFLQCAHSLRVDKQALDISEEAFEEMDQTKTDGNLTDEQKLATAALLKKLLDELLKQQKANNDLIASANANFNANANFIQVLNDRRDQIQQAINNAPQKAQEIQAKLKKQEEELIKQAAQELIKQAAQAAQEQEINAANNAPPNIIQVLKNQAQEKKRKRN